MKVDLQITPFIAYLLIRELRPSSCNLKWRQLLKLLRIPQGSSKPTVRPGKSSRVESIIEAQT